MRKRGIRLVVALVLSAALATGFNLAVHANPWLSISADVTLDQCILDCLQVTRC